MSKFPVSSGGALGNKLIDKVNIDNSLYFDNLGALGPEWGDSFCSPMRMRCTDGTYAYKVPFYYRATAPIYSTGLAANATDIFLCGSSSVRPTKYNKAAGTWSEGTMPYVDFASLSMSNGAFSDSNNYLYFFTNTPDPATTTNNLLLRRYDPVANTWTTLASLTGAAATVIYAHIGVANGYAYFMQLYKSITPANVPAGFPCFYRYNLSGNTWSSVAVTPPLFHNAIEEMTTVEQRLSIPNNAYSTRITDTAFLIMVKSTKGYTGDIYQYDTADGTVTYVCTMKSRGLGYVGASQFPGGSVGTTGAPLSYLVRDTKIFFSGGVIYKWTPNMGGLDAYIIAAGKQYYIPIPALKRLNPLCCESGGKIYMMLGINDMIHPSADGSIQYVYDDTGVIVDIAGISAFLTRDKTIAVSTQAFN